MRFLARLFPSQDIDALVGDIAEESRRRSRIWRWYQLLALVVVAPLRVVRAHPLLTLRAIGVGIAALVASVAAVLSILAAWGELLRYLGTGVLIGGHWFRVYWPRVMVDGHWFRVPWPNWTPVTLFVLAILTACAVSGWIVRRLHRAHGIALVIPFALSVPLFLLLSVFILNLIRTGEILIVSPAGAAVTLTPYIVIRLVLALIVRMLPITAAILLGACLDQRA